jgi:hypothetical protein
MESVPGQQDRRRKMDCRQVRPGKVGKLIFYV